MYFVIQIGYNNTFKVWFISFKNILYLSVVRKGNVFFMRGVATEELSGQLINVSLCSSLADAVLENMQECQAASRSGVIQNVKEHTDIHTWGNLMESESNS